MKKILSVILIAVLTISIVACGSSSKALVGRWELNSDKTEWGHDIPRFPDFEFFSNGTYSSSLDRGISDSYTTEGNRLVLSKQSKGYTFTYTVTGNELVLDDGSSNHFVYNRTN